MQWGGALNLFDKMLNAPITVRTFGSFDGTVPNPQQEKWLAEVIHQAVEAAAKACVVDSVLQLDKKKEQIAAQALAQIAPQLQQVGAVGRITITAFSFSEEDRERLMAASAQAAQRNRERIMAEMAAKNAAAAPEPQQAATGACTKCGASVVGKFCPACGTPRAVVDAPTTPVAAAATPPPQQVHASPLGAGAHVLVQWSDGNRYPGTVSENRGDQILVTFPNGSSNWIPANFVTPAPLQMSKPAELLSGMTRHGWVVEPTRNPERVDARVSYQGPTDRLVLEHRANDELWLWMVALDDKRCIGLGKTGHAQSLTTIAAMQDQLSVASFLDAYSRLQKVGSPTIMAWEQFQKAPDGLSENYGVELLFDKTPTLDDHTIDTALAAALPGVRRVAAGHWALPSGSQLAVRAVPAPRPFDSALSQTWNWDDAGEAVKHVKQALLVTDLAAGGLPRPERLGNLFKLLRAVLAQHAPAAIHWIPTQRIVDPAWVNSVPAGKELALAVNVRYFRSPPGHFMDTRGLDVFGLPDIECRFIDFEPGAMTARLETIAQYIWAKGDVFDESDTMAGLSDEEWEINHGFSSTEPVRAVLQVVAGRNALDADGDDEEDED